MIDRRQLSAALLLALAGSPSFAGARADDDLAQRLADIEKASGGRLGVCVLDVASGARTGHRADERFPMCSTFKLLASAAVLARVDRGQDSLDRRVVFGPSDLVPYSPGTEKHAGAPGLTVAQLCEAAITLSDNTAANLLLARIGGPEGFTRYARSLGDNRTRLDRIEPGLNEDRPGDPRDTTTPRAMLHSLQQLLIGDALSAGSRAQLKQWLAANQTGGQRLRAGVPADWAVGDKTGTGANGTANVIGILQPPGRAPILVTAYLTGTRAASDAQSATLAAVGSAIAGTSH